MIAREIKFPNSLTVLENALQFTQTVQSNIVLAKSKHFKMPLLSQCFAESFSALREDSIARQPDLRYVLCVLKDFSDMPCTVWTDKVV